MCAVDTTGPLFPRCQQNLCEHTIILTDALLHLNSFDIYPVDTQAQTTRPAGYKTAKLAHSADLWPG